MPLPLARYKLVRRIGADLDALERVGVRAALRVGTIARQRAYAAWNTTRDVYAVRMAIRNVLIGNATLELPGLMPLITDAMVAAHLDGRRRTGLNLREHVDAGLKLSTAYDGAIEFLTKRLDLNTDELRALQEAYGSTAASVTTTASESLEQAVQQSLVESTAAGEGVRDGVQAMREAFESEGFTPAKDHQLEAIFRTQTQTAYSAGRWQSLQDPALGDLIWGFEYTAILDARVTELCRSMNGVIRPKDDPIWDRLTPPNHWNCRSTLLEVLDTGNPTAVPVGAVAQQGFGFNPGQVFRPAA
jgi:SPP1 gp7 family putative phage head morphogenesis protein